MNARIQTAVRAVLIHTHEDGRRVFAMLDAEGHRVATYSEEPIGGAS